MSDLKWTIIAFSLFLGAFYLTSAILLVYYDIKLESGVLREVLISTGLLILGVSLFFWTGHE